MRGNMLRDTRPVRCHKVTKRVCSVPRIGVDGSETHLPTGLDVFGDAALLAVTKVEVADEELVLAGGAQWAEPPSACEKLGAPLSDWPGEVSRTWVHFAQGVVARLVETGGNRVWWQISQGSISHSPSRTVDVELKRLLADLRFLSASPRGYL